MNLPERDRRDLEDLAGIFFSPAAPPPGGPSPAGPAARAVEDRPASSPARAGESLVLVLSLEDDPGPDAGASPLARAAAEVARPRFLPRERRGEIHPLLRPGREATLAPGPGPGFLPVPPRDGPALRWGLVVTPRVLAWCPARPGLLRDLENLLLVLEEACPDPHLGWLRDPALPAPPVQAILAAWRERAAPAASTPLGAWRPGEPLPTAAREFLAGPPRARAPLPRAAAR